MSKSQFEEECTLSDHELIKKVEELNSNLCKKGYSAWSMRVPPDPDNDSDFLISELVKRFQKLITK